ncbi:hypothetical protein WDZ17_04835 [Pseudokineococcus basanitobsidens]|uniref:Uncharacterized protein n=1 Tax=Pseudokineococcus basanitobsidens TaxID=1926649 RepID=A0ABU8RHQ5_9ACTN
MSREALGRRREPPAPPGGPAQARGAPDRDGPDASGPDPSRPDPDELDAPRATRAGPDRPGRRSRGARLRGATALLLAAALGAGGALLAVRGDGTDVRLVVVSAAPDLGADVRAGRPADGLAVRLVVASLATQDLTVVGGGTSGPRGRLEGAVGTAGAARAGGPGLDRAPAVPATGTGELVLEVPGTCDDPPPWRPWLRVLGASGATEVVDLEGLPEAARDEPLRDVCALQARTRLSPVSVTGSRTTPEGTVSLALTSTAPVPYRLRVDDGGISGLSPVVEGVEIPPGTTTQVALAVAPPRCLGAVRADDLLGDALVQAVRSGGDDGDGPEVVPVDLSVAEAHIALAVGRVCAGA